MSLLPMARRLVADKARGKAAGDAAPAPIPASPAPAADADELDEAVAGAQSKLALAAAGKAMRHDPYQHILTGLSDTLGVLPTMVRRWDAAVQDVIDARHPLTLEERADLASALVEATKDGAYEGTRKEAARMIRRLDRGLSARIGLCIGGAFVAGCAITAGAFFCLSAGPFRPDMEAGAAWREVVQLNSDPRPLFAAGEVRTDRTGRRYHAGVSLWMDPPPLPPGTPGKP